MKKLYHVLDRTKHFSREIIVSHSRFVGEFPTEDFAGLINPILLRKTVYCASVRLMNPGSEYNYSRSSTCPLGNYLY